MNKTELIESLSEETSFSRKDISRVLDALSRILVRALKNEGKLQWSGLGTFSVACRAPRKGINPATKERIDLPEIQVPKFKAGKNFKQLIRSAKDGSKRSGIFGAGM